MADPRTVTGPDGKPYEFPADASDQEILGFFKKQEPIVRAESGAAHLATGPQTLTDAPDKAEPDTASIGEWMKQPITKDRLNAVLSSAAHPQTVGDFLQLLVPGGIGNVAAGRTAVVGDTTKEAVANVAGDIKKGVQSAISTTDAPHGIVDLAVAPAKYGMKIAKGAITAQRERQADDALIAAAEVSKPAPAAGMGRSAFNDAMAEAVNKAKGAPTAVAEPVVEPPAAAAPNQATPTPVLGKDVMAVKAAADASKIKLTALESQQALKWLGQGVPADKVWERISAARDLSASETFSPMAALKKAIDMKDNRKVTGKYLP